MNFTCTSNPSKRWRLAVGIIALTLVIVLCSACGKTTHTGGSTAPAPSVTESTENTGTGISDGELRSDFKEAMDSYENFMNDYAEFVKKYKDNPTDTSLLADYADYMTKYADVVEEFDKWESEDLNDAELAYYIDVQARVSKLLLESAS